MYLSLFDILLLFLSFFITINANAIEARNKVQPDISRFSIKGTKTLTQRQWIYLVVQRLLWLSGRYCAYSDV